MVYAKNFIFLLTIWTTFNFILAQEGSGHGELGSGPINPPGIHEGPHDAHNERQSSLFGFGQIPSFLSGLSSMPGFGSFLSSGAGLGSLSEFGFPFFGGSNGTRSMSPPQDEDYDDDEDSAEDGPQSRLFFSSLFNTRLTTCNYTTQAGSTCSSCRQVLTCFRSNVGKLKTCKKFFPYCNNGRCSLFPGAACSSATTAATTTAATTTADATTATTT